MTLTTMAPGPATIADLEALAGLSIGPEYVLRFAPPQAPARGRRTCPGQWHLLTIDDYNAGNPPRDDWTMEGPRDTPEPDLAAWAGELLGYPVALEAAPARMKAGKPLYWVRRNT
jgi:hypothetical protein